MNQRKVLNVRIRALDQQIGQLSTQRSALLQTKLSVDQAVVIDGDNPVVSQVPSGLLPRMALALVLGLVIGLALAVLLETLAPRLAGIRALARSLAAPVLGRTDQSASELGAAMTLTARRQGVETVVLLGVDARDSSVATALLGRLPKPGSAKVPSSPGGNSPARPAASPSSRRPPGGPATRSGSSRSATRSPSPRSPSAAWTASRQRPSGPPGSWWCPRARATSVTSTTCRTGSPRSAGR